MPETARMANANSFTGLLLISAVLLILDSKEFFFYDYTHKNFFLRFLSSCFLFAIGEVEW